MNTQLLCAILLIVISTSQLENMRIDTSNARLTRQDIQTVSSGSLTVQVPDVPYTITANNYPIRAVYIDTVNQYSDSNLAADLGIPGEAVQSNYNYVILSEWTCSKNSIDAVLVWQNVAKYLGESGIYGSTTKEIQKNVRSIFNQEGVKLMVSAFRAEENPTSLGLDPTQCAHKLGHFVIDNHFDGAQIDWQDNIALEKGTGQQWLVTFTKELRNIIPNHIISHGPFASFFRDQSYKNRGYVAVNEAVGHLINFYAVKFYDLRDSEFNSYETLFLKSSGSFTGSSVKQIADRGIPLNKIVVGKPIFVTDGITSGRVEPQQLGEWTQRAYEQLNWYGGLILWEHSFDPSGSVINKACEVLIYKCSTEKNCK